MLLCLLTAFITGSRAESQLSQEQRAGLDPWLQVKVTNASLKACLQTNRLDAYASMEAPTCYAYFNRDTSSRHYCADQSCGISAAVNAELGTSGMETCSPPSSFVRPTSGPNFFLDAHFLEKGRRAAPIPCSRILFQSFGPDSTKCTAGSSWRETPADQTIHNFMHADFEAPQYQVMSCCSSHARFGFAGLGAYPQQGNIHDPWSYGQRQDNDRVKVGCEVNRKSYMGNSCGSFADGWAAFAGHGTCGIRTTVPSSAHGAELPRLLQYATRVNKSFARNVYCKADFIKQECERLQSYYGSSQQGGVDQPCSSPVGGMTAMNMRTQCPQFDASAANARIIDLQDWNLGPPATPLTEAGMAGCQTCRALLKAMSAFPCSGLQSSFVYHGEFRICKSTCTHVFETCGLPTHYGGMYMSAKWNGTQILGDYWDAESFCHALWHPHPKSIWAVEGIALKVIDDISADSEGQCASFERAVYNLQYDTQNFVFDYGAIRGGNGFCALEDPLYDKAAPCADLNTTLQRDLARTTGRRLAQARTQGGGSMYSLRDDERAQKLAEGWPWESGSTSGVDAVDARGPTVVLVPLSIGLGLMF